MTDFRSETEKQLHDIIRDVLHFMESPRVSGVQFRTLVGELRDGKVLLDNKQYGCLTGKHEGACHCQLNEPVYPTARPAFPKGME
jgi:hypothetical protein